MVRRVVFLVLLAGVLVCGWRFGPGIFRQGRVLYLQRECMTYSAPGDRVVYDENSETTAERLKTAGYAGLWTSGTKQAAIFIAPPVKNMGGNLPAGGNLLGAKPGSGATVFLHELRNSAGIKRLVLIERSPARGFGPPFNYAFGFDVYLFEEATWTRGPEPLITVYGMEWDGMVVDPPTRGLRFYAGQIDPSDAGHFTIRYDLEGKSGVIDGRLNDAGNDVKMAIRSGPATAPSPWSTEVGR